MEIKIASSQKEIFQVARLRCLVFSCEQQFDPAIEIDDEDYTATHFLLMDNDLPIGTCRANIDKDKIHIGRFVILKEYRKQGLGSLLLDSVEKHYKDYKYFYLFGQLRASKFYESCGYKKIGDIFLDDGVEHIRMEKIYGN